VIRADIWMRGVGFEADRLAAARHQAPPFHIERVLFAIAVVAFVAALARPLRSTGAAARVIPRQHVRIVAAAALACFVAITVLVRV
jgi:hypothetical protein